MAKIKIANLAPRATNSRRSGFVLRDTIQGTVAAKWPKKRGFARSGWPYFQQTEFGLAAAWASDPLPNERLTADFEVKGTELVWRDRLIQAMYGYAYEIVRVDGSIMIPEREVDPNAQLILDQVTQTVGSILYRADIGWLGLPPGNNADVLTITGALPSWQAPSGGTGSEQPWKLLDQSGAPTTAAQSWAWSTNTPNVDFTGLATYNEIMATWANVAGTGNSQYGWRFSQDNGSTFDATSGHYNAVTTAGTLTPGTSIIGNTGPLAAAQYGRIHIPTWKLSAPKFITSMVNPCTSYYSPTGALNALRFLNITGSNQIASGTIWLYGR